MQLDNFITQLPKKLKWLVAIFLIVLAVGFYTGLGFVKNTTDGTPKGIIENYNGNEEDLEAEEMKFKKSDREMLTIIHTHILSMSLIFVLLGFLVYGCPMNPGLKSFLMIEPLVSVLLTFGGIYLLWAGHLWMTYVVMLSGALMVLSFTLAQGIILFNLSRRIQ